MPDINKFRNSGRCPRGERPIARADAALRDFFREQLAAMRPSRIQLCDALAKDLGEPVSLSRLDSFVASTKLSARLPGYFIPSLCKILEDDALLLFLARPRIRELIQFAERELAAAKDESERRLLRDKLLGEGK